MKLSCAKRRSRRAVIARNAARLSSIVLETDSWESIQAGWEQTEPSWVRSVIHEFNERGMASLRPRYRGGRPRRITTDQRQQIISVAGARPDHQALAVRGQAARNRRLGMHPGHVHLGLRVGRDHVLDRRRSDRRRGLDGGSAPALDVRALTEFADTLDVPGLAELS